MIWTRIKRWLVTHPRWSLIVSSWLGFAIVLVPLGAMLAIGLGRNMGNQQATVFLSAVLTGLWLLATSASAYGFGILSAKSGLPIRAIRRKWPWLWAGLAPLWLPVSLTAALSRFDNMWIVPAMALIATATLSASGMLCMLAGLGLAGNRAQRQLASGRWATIGAVSPELFGPAAAERQKVDRWTVGMLSAATTAVAYGYFPLQLLIDWSDIIPNRYEESVAGWAGTVMALGYIGLVVGIALRRVRAGLTNTDLVLVGTVRPWLCLPVLGAGLVYVGKLILIPDEVGHSWRVLELFGLFLFCSMLLVSAWLFVFLTTAIIWLIRWHRDPRYRPSAMKEFDQ